MAHPRAGLVAGRWVDQVSQRLTAKMGDHKIRKHDHQNFSTPDPKIHNHPPARKCPKPGPHRPSATEPIPKSPPASITTSQPNETLVLKPTASPSFLPSTSQAYPE